MDIMLFSAVVNWIYGRRSCLNENCLLIISIKIPYAYASRMLTLLYSDESRDRLALQPKLANQSFIRTPCLPKTPSQLELPVTVRARKGKRRSIPLLLAHTPKQNPVKIPITNSTSVKRWLLPLSVCPGSRYVLKSHWLYLIKTWSSVRP